MWLVGVGMEACIDLNYLSLAALFPVVENLTWSNLSCKEYPAERTGLSMQVLWSMLPCCHCSWYIMMAECNLAQIFNFSYSSD